MTGLVRARYTLEFKQKAVRLVRGGQTVSLVAKTLGRLSEQTLHNWLKAEAAGGLREITGKVVSAERMEIEFPHGQRLKIWGGCPETVRAVIRELVRPC